MLLSSKKKNGQSLEMDELKKMRNQYEEDKQFYINTVRSLLILIKQFPLNLKEIDTDGFAHQVNALTEKFVSGKKTAQIRSVFEKYKKIIFSFIKIHKEYLGEREKDFKEIIDILTKAMMDLGVENQNYNERIYKQTENIEKLTLLDNIKAIKSAIKEEVSQIRASIIEKQETDNRQITTLSKKVSTLETQLKKAESESLKDGLTGIYNRLAFDNHIKNKVEMNAIGRSPFSLLMIDIDDFKKINDAYGHQVGDRVILAVVQKFLAFIRTDDFPARYGGEEFAIVLSGATLRNAVKKGKQICKALAATRYSVSNADDNDQYLNITVSVGVAYAHKDDTVETVIRRADNALYQAKQAGKNRAVSEKELN